jgi:hypothetical protein
MDCVDDFANIYLAHGSMITAMITTTKDVVSFQVAE